MIKIIEEYTDNIKLFSLKDEQLEVHVSNYGGTITKILFPNREGKIIDLVYGYEDIAEYGKRDGYLGALVGRVANRIAKGQFTINGIDYQVSVNNGPNSLHGGIRGFSYQVFNYDIQDDTLILSYISSDGEEGYPGELTLKAFYSVKNNALEIKYQAITTKDTLINITNHSYFNLNGDASSIHNHKLLIKSSFYCPIDKNGLTNGQKTDVANTPFDFRKPTLIGEKIRMDNKQLRLGHGYDHPFVFDQDHDQVILSSDQSGISLVVSTTLPQAQIYTANYLDGRLGKYGQHYHGQTAVCIETQNMPDSIHNEAVPSVLLKKDAVYEEKTKYCFFINSF